MGRLPAMGVQAENPPRWDGLLEVLGMAWPIILGIMSFTVMQFVDQVMVSRLGRDALAAVGSAGIWAFTLSTFFLGVVRCVATFASQSLGRGEKENCAHYTWQGIYIAVMTGAVALLLWPLAGPLFRLMRHSEAVTRLELVYFRVRLFGYVFIAWQASLASFYEAVNRPRIPMYVALVSNVLNVVLDYVLIFGKWGFPAFGIGGAAVATVVSLATQVALLQWVFTGREMNREYNTRRAYGIDAVKIRELLRIGWPNGIAFLLDVATWGVFTSIIVGGLGTVQLAAHNAASNFMHLSFMPALGLNHAVAAIVGRWIGRGDIATAKARTYTAMRLAMVYMFVMGIVLAVFGRYLIWRCFSTDPEVIRLGRMLLILAAVFQAFDAVNITCIGALRGAGDTRWMAVAMFVAAYSVFLPLSLFLARMLGWGAVGAWIGATVYVIGLSGVLFGRFRGERWRHISIFTQDRVQPAV